MSARITVGQKSTDMIKKMRKYITIPYFTRSRFRLSIGMGPTREVTYGTAFPFPGNRKRHRGPEFRSPRSQEGIGDDHHETVGLRVQHELRPGGYRHRLERRGLVRIPHRGHPPGGKRPLPARHRGPGRARRPREDPGTDRMGGPVHPPERGSGVRPRPRGRALEAPDLPREGPDRPRGGARPPLPRPRQTPGPAPRPPTPPPPPLPPPPHP